MEVLEHIDLGTVITLIVMVGGFVVTVLVMRTAFSKDIQHNTENIKRNDGHIGELFTKTDSLETHKMSEKSFDRWRTENREDIRGITEKLTKVDDKLDQSLRNGRNHV